MTAITRFKFKRREFNSLAFKWIVVANDYNYGYVRVPSVTYVAFRNIAWKAPVTHLTLRKIVHE